MGVKYVTSNSKERRPCLFFYLIFLLFTCFLRSVFIVVLEFFDLGFQLYILFFHRLDRV